MISNKLKKINFQNRSVISAQTKSGRTLKKPARLVDSDEEVSITVSCFIIILKKGDCNFIKTSKL